MEKIQWSEQYSIKNKTIDAQHKNLFKIAQEAFGVVEPSQKKQKIKTVIEKVLRYTKVHFSHEEKYMSSISYPALESHKILHQKIIDSMNTFLKEMRNKSISTIEHELAYFIDIWFVKHITIEDIKISKWAAKNKITKEHFPWKQSYCVGNKKIDDEHKALFALANSAFDFNNVTDHKEHIKNVIKELFSYFENHFQSEEQYMQSINYDSLDEHKVIHSSIMQTLQEFIKKISTMDIVDIEIELERFVYDSLIAHILNEDSKIIQWKNLMDETQGLKKIISLE